MDDEHLEAVQGLWAELGLTRLLEEHIPPERRYLVDRLVRLLFPPGSGRGA
jgi:hypothetical protein